MAYWQEMVDRIEKNEQLDDLSGPLAEIVSGLTSSDGVKQALSGGWLGHQLHPMLTDVPIGAWVSASALDILGGRREARAARKLVAIGVLSSIPAAASGASDWADTYGGEQRVGLVHALANATAIALQATSYVARRRNKRYTGAVLSLAGLAATMGAGYLGGHLSFALGVGVNHAAFEFPTEEWTDVAAEGDLTEGEPRRVEADGVAVVLVHHAGAIHALSATCGHAGGPLDEGEISGDCIVCPWHRSYFRLRDGTAQRGPAAVPQPVWETRVTDGRIEVRAAS